ncbi:hypothetical protein Phi18:3_gp062 [Cellulophaga phage phi18:3]|uniref:Uncharacterized protein n=1 Tax=Cellulophaga phage phi18:3 TaxID=1327983 RepID=R9ZZ10_9CAUD|nr:hypothetical protein Phi18:3_gp062 [Cellulophaga phage phi18:3]AGO48574.1 hypothetical protein Phi18:3_gp062 [Cellulophaga phage phi18:3]
MKKRKITNDKFEELSIVIESEKVTDIDKVIDFLLNSKNEGATNVCFSGLSHFVYNDRLEKITIKPVKITIESDEDFNTRLLREEKSKELAEEMIIKNDLAELKRLKDKYES